jgi:demethylmenaquinone methyltransferase/2-methoxy-6-polyprenyl-1,4-benzoquinol methylase
MENAQEYTAGKKDFFNDHAKTWDESPRHNLTKVQAMIQLLGIEQGSKVLDVGTGTGVIIPLLSKLSGEQNITAIDFAENMIAAAKKKFSASAVTFIAGDALSHPFESGSFDFVICYSAFPHLDNHREAFRRLAGLLKQDGRIAIMHSSGREAINKGHSSYEPLKHDMLPPPEVLRDYIRENGLREEIMIDMKKMFMLCARRI